MQKRMGWFVRFLNIMRQVQCRKIRCTCTVTVLQCPHSGSKHWQQRATHRADVPKTLGTGCQALCILSGKDTKRKNELGLRMHKDQSKYPLLSLN